MTLISKPINLSTEANLLYEIYRTLSRIHIVGGSGGSGVQSVTGTLVDNTDPLNPIINTPSFAETLAEDNKTNDIPIVSNNGYSAINVNDDYLLLGYDNGDGSSNITFDGIQTSIQGLILASIYSGAVIQLTAESSMIIDAPAVDINTSILKYNTEEVATQNWVTSQGYGTGTVNSVAVSTANGFAGSSSGGADPSLTISTTATGVLKGNGTAISAATAETDYTTPTGAGALTNKTMSGVTNTFTNIPLTTAVTGILPEANGGTTRKDYGVYLTYDPLDPTVPIVTAVKNTLGVTVTWDYDISTAKLTGTISGTPDFTNCYYNLNPILTAITGTGVTIRSVEITTTTFVITLLDEYYQPDFAFFTLNNISIHIYKL